MPDEHREALQILLLFLKEVASYSEANQVSCPIHQLAGGRVGGREGRGGEGGQPVPQRKWSSKPSLQLAVQSILLATPFTSKLATGQEGVKAASSSKNLEV